MNRSTKIILGVAVPLAIFGGYWFITRNREPYLDLDGTDWMNSIANVKFGKNTKSVPVGGSGILNAGSTFSDKYRLEYSSSGKNITFFVKDKDGNIYDKRVVDFGAKIIY
jgi:hypothetical protein